MTVYNINLGIGWASSGVEYAQAYRATIFRKLKQPAKFIFTDMFVTENLQHLTENIGFTDDEIIWLYGFFTDVKIKRTSFTLEDLKRQMHLPITREERNGKQVRYFYEKEDIFVSAYLVDEDDTRVHRVEYVAKGVLVRKDFYSYTKMFSEFYYPLDGKAHLHSRKFYNEDGSLAYEELVEGERSIFRFSDRFLYGKPALVSYMLEKLGLTNEDIILLDRATGIGSAVFESKGQARLAVVIHAEHFSENATTKENILWNNYYEYQFTNADKVDAFIASTAVQKDILSEQFATYTEHRPEIYAIPVGSLSACRKPKQARRPFSLVTASRLASEKHIDWLVEAVAIAKKEVPELTFDIYGSGGQEARLRDLIDKHAASGYIRLMGHQDLTEIYADYEAYIAASTSEGFGLTLMEAIGSGLPIIGLDVRYGNQTFIDDGENGYLIPRPEIDEPKEMAKAFAEKIIQLFKAADLAAFEAHAYDKAQPFLQESVEAQWQEFLKVQVTHG